MTMEQRDLGTVKSLLRTAIGRDGYAAVFGRLEEDGEKPKE